MMILEMMMMMIIIIVFFFFSSAVIMVRRLVSNELRAHKPLGPAEEQRQVSSLLSVGDFATVCQSAATTELARMQLFGKVG